MGNLDQSVSILSAADLDATSAAQSSAGVEEEDVKRARVVARGSPYLSSKQVARYLGFLDQSLQNMRRRGTGPRFVRLGRQVRYHVRDLMAYVQHPPQTGQGRG